MIMRKKKLDGTNPYADVQSPEQLSLLDSAYWQWNNKIYKIACCINGDVVDQIRSWSVYGDMVCYSYDVKDSWDIVQGQQFPASWLFLPYDEVGRRVEQIKSVKEQDEYTL